eukprot:1159594-Pelagomonas_calceolata.AAC.3
MSWLDIIDFPQPLWHGLKRYFGAKTRRADCVSLSWLRTVLACLPRTLSQYPLRNRGGGGAGGAGSTQR